MASGSPLAAPAQERASPPGEAACAATLWALADPIRLQLVQRLARGPCSASRLGEGLPVSRTAVARRLNSLWRARLVSYRRSGPRNVYRLERGPLQELDAFLSELDQVAGASEARWRRLRALWLDRI